MDIQMYRYQKAQRRAERVFSSSSDYMQSGLRAGRAIVNVDADADPSPGRRELPQHGRGRQRELVRLFP
jgi:hypothetical protein